MRPVLRQENSENLSILAEMSIHAAQEAITQAEINVRDIDAVILGTSHSARNYPSVAMEVMENLGIEGYGYDMLVGCSSTTFAINNAFSDIASWLANTILVVNPEISTPACNFAERD